MSVSSHADAVLVERRRGRGRRRARRVLGPLGAIGALGARGPLGLRLAGVGGGGRGRRGPVAGAVVAVGAAPRGRVVATRGGGRRRVGCGRVASAVAVQRAASKHKGTFNFVCGYLY